MAEFCTQCHLEMFPPLKPDQQYDFEGLTTLEDIRDGKYALVLCEGCGATQVAPDGSCVGGCMHKEHGSMAHYLDLMGKVMDQPDIDPEARKALKMKRFAIIYGLSTIESMQRATREEIEALNRESNDAPVQDLREGSEQPGGPAL